MESEWKLVTDYVKLEFETYLPVPTIADIERYRPLNFLILNNGASLVSEKKWKTFNPFECMRKHRQRPNFDSIGLIDNFAVLRPSPEGVSYISLPKIHDERLFDHDEEGKSRTVVEGQINSVEGSVDMSTPLPSLGLISRHDVKYRDLRAWVEKFSFMESAEDIFSEAKHGNLFIIQDVITAEKLLVKGSRNQNTSGGILSYLKWKYETKASLDLKRPSEFGHFPIAFKISKIKVRRTKHAAHTSAMASQTILKPSSPTNTADVYQLKLEPLRDFSQSCFKRNFGKENSPLSDDSGVSPSSRVSKRTSTEQADNESIEPKARRRLDMLR